ncbi:hypothetical protein D3C80_1407570 [compost metagenome]
MFGRLGSACDHPGALFGAAVEHAVEHHQRGQALWVMQGEGAGHQAAHGEADDGCLRHLQVLEQLGQLRGIAGQAGAGCRTRALAVAEHVVGNDPVIAGQANDLPAPHFFVQAHAVDQDHGLALAGRQVTGAGRGAFSNRLNHRSLLGRNYCYCAFSAASSSRSM